MSLKVPNKVSLIFFNHCPRLCCQFWQLKQFSRRTIYPQQPQHLWRWHLGKNHKVKKMQILKKRLLFIYKQVCQCPLSSQREKSRNSNGRTNEVHSTLLSMLLADKASKSQNQQQHTCLEQIYSWCGWASSVSKKTWRCQNTKTKVSKSAESIEGAKSAESAKGTERVLSKQRASEAPRHRGR